MGSMVIGIKIDLDFFFQNGSHFERVAEGRSSKIARRKRHPIMLLRELCSFVSPGVSVFPVLVFLLLLFCFSYRFSILTPEKIGSKQFCHIQNGHHSKF